MKVEYRPLTGCTFRIDPAVVGINGSIGRGQA
jgi:hypothetical protein